MKPEYSQWLAEQKYADGTITAQMHRAGRVEQHYGDLDEHYNRDLLQGLIADLKYSTEDERRNKPNPSKIPFNGNVRKNLASYRDAVERYCRFRRETYGLSSDVDIDVVKEVVSEHRQLIGLERDMQAALRLSIQQLEQGLEVIDEGAERSVSSGFIDITAKDVGGALVVIELKTGIARGDAVAQILGYMSDLIDEEPDAKVRGILVAGDFDKRARAAARMIPTLSLRTYRVNFEFSEILKEKIDS